MEETTNNKLYTPLSKKILPAFKRPILYSSNVVLYREQIGRQWLVTWRNILLFGCLCCLLNSCKKTPEQMRYSSWQSSPTEEKVMREILDNFSEKFPSNSFKYEPIPGNYSEKIQLMLGTNTAPDLLWLKGYTSPSYLKLKVVGYK